MRDEKIPQTIEEVIADFSGDVRSAAKYISMRDGISRAEAKEKVKNADQEKVKMLVTKNRIDALSTCPVCSGDDITISTSTHVESESRSFLWNLFMVIITGFLWLIWMLIRGKKETIVETKTAVCQKCGHSWEVY